MESTKYLKLNAFLLFLILPLSVMGYFFAVYNESLFFLYEWLLTLFVLASIIIAIISIVKIKGNLKWISIAILAFLLQFSVMSLFLGPITKYGLFYLFYIVTILAFVAYFIAIKKAGKYKLFPILFIIISAAFTLYMILLNNLWGRDLS